MRDIWHRTLKFLDHERGLVAGLLVAALAAGILFGCEITTASVIDPGRKVNVAQLQAEIGRMGANFAERKAMLEAQTVALNADIDAFNAAVDASAAEVERKQQLRQQAVSVLGGFAVDAASGTLNPVAAIASLFTLLSAGAAVGIGADNLRKNGVIAKMKTATSGAPPPAATSPAA